MILEKRQNFSNDLLNFSMLLKFITFFIYLYFFESDKIMSDFLNNEIFKESNKSFI